MSDKPFSREEFKEIFSKVPRFCVEVLIRSPKGLLLAKRGEGNGWEGMWHFTGGMVQYREGIENAIHRIAMGETGTKVKIVKNLGLLEFLDEEKERGFGYSISNSFLCDLVEGEPRPDEDSSALEFFTEIPDNLIPEHRQLLEDNWDEIRKDTF